MPSGSKVISRSPFFTLSSCFTCTWKYFPFSSTVSRPMWIRSSTPSFVCMPSACPVSNTDMMVPSSGARTSPFAGTTAAPFPTISLEKTSSFTSLNGITFPSMGESITILAAGEAAFCAAFSSAAGSSADVSSVSSLGSSKPRIRVAMAVATMEMRIVITALITLPKPSPPIYTGRAKIPAVVEEKV